MHRFGGDIYGEIGFVKDTRQDTDFHFGLGFSLNYRLIKSSPFSIGPIFNIPLNFHIRSDDSDRIVFLPNINPRIGAQSEIMINPKFDLVIRIEYILRSANIGSWRYTEKNTVQGENGQEEVTETFSAQWIDKPPPTLNYHGWNITFGIRFISAVELDSRGFSLGNP